MKRLLTILLLLPLLSIAQYRRVGKITGGTAVTKWTLSKYNLSH